MCVWNAGYRGEQNPTDPNSQPEPEPKNNEKPEPENPNNPRTQKWEPVVKCRFGLGSQIPTRNPNFLIKFIFFYILSSITQPTEDLDMEDFEVTSWRLKMVLNS